MENVDGMYVMRSSDFASASTIRVSYARVLNAIEALVENQYLLEVLYVDENTYINTLMPLTARDIFSTESS